MMAGPQTGFRTMGGCVLIGEIPSGWKTGRHRHGEESIYILDGEGYSLIGGKKYSWQAG
jgi:gentisate 1,2-dioxygenase